MDKNKHYGNDDLSSDGDCGDINSNSSKTKLSEGEFTIGNFNISDGGLKLTISCRKKSFENELDESTNDRSDRSPRAIMKPQSTVSALLNTESAESTAVESITLNQVSSDESGGSETKGAQHPCSPSSTSVGEELVQNVGLSRRNLHQGTELDTAAKSGTQKNAPADKQTPQSSLLLKKKDQLSSVELHHAHRSSENITTANTQVLPKGKLNGCEGSCALEVQEPILRMDTLPNVSPESGISSLDEAPYGNESPDFNANLRDTSTDGQSVGQNCNSSGSSSRVTADASHIVNNSHSESPEEKEHRSLDLSESISTGVTEDDGDARESISICRDDVILECERNSPSTQEFSAIDSKTDSASVHCSQSPPSSYGVLISSPHKISKSLGRKKRGRPAKSLTTKTMLLKHKKSSLYNSSFELNSTDTLAHTPGEKEEKESKNNNSDTISDGNKSASEAGSTKSATEGDDILKSSSSHKVESDTSENLLIQPPDGPHENVEKSVLDNKDFKEVAHNVPKRPRGRPRKSADVFIEDSLSGASLVSMGQAIVNKQIKKKHSKKKLMFTHTKRKRPIYNNQSEIPIRKVGKKKTMKNQVSGSFSEERQVNMLTMFEHNSGGLYNPSKGFDVKESDNLCGDINLSQQKRTESSIFQDNDLDALLLSVKSSIKSQFKEDGYGNPIPSPTFENPFTLTQPPTFPKVSRPLSPRTIKPKPKRPKLHVMMRQTKRRKKKVHSKPVPSPEPKIPPSPPPKLEMFSPVTKHEKTEKFYTSSYLQRRSLGGSFGSALTGTMRPFFTSCIQPSKILASSRLNVFRSGTGVEEPYQTIPPPDVDASAVENYEKKMKKRHKLLYRKSKHKNIVDPVFSADLDGVLDDLGAMTIKENPAENFIRVRPGEVPLPSIFRVIKIDVNRRIKDKLFPPEIPTVDKLKVGKGRKDSVSPSNQPSPPSFRPVVKSSRKKSTSDAAFDTGLPSGDSCDQRLPPKKRHRMVNMEASPLVDSDDNLASPVVVPRDTKFGLKRKGKRSRKISGPEEGKSDLVQVPGRSCLSQSLCQELTIDTGDGHLGCSSSLSPYQGRLSARSSTLPSLSSPSASPAESASGTRNRLTGYGKQEGNCNSSVIPCMACPVHSTSSLSSVSGTSSQSTCAECNLLQQSLTSMSPGSLRSERFNLRPLSCSAATESGSSERRNSSIEPSPNYTKLTPPILDKPSPSSSRISFRKRRKSSTLSDEESDSLPPKLEKTSCISPRTNIDNLFSEPPVITIPDKLCVSPKQELSAKSPSGGLGFSKHSPSYVPRKRAAPKVTRKTGKLTVKKVTSVKQPARRMCNSYVSLASKKSSRSVITMSCPEFEPLPLEHCSNRRLVEEIKAATTVKSDKNTIIDEESSSDEDPLPSPVQPPRKKYQRVGLFSDFYKIIEPRKRLAEIKDKDPRLAQAPGIIPMPMHIGDFYMRQRLDFELPYDIWWQHKHQQLPKRAEPKIKFRNIRTNVYSEKVNVRRLEIPSCSCQTPANGGKGCLDDCLNRMIYTECSPSTCPLGENCGNQRIQRHEWAPGLEKTQTTDRGVGVVTKHSIKSGQLILEYLGEVLPETEFRRRMVEDYSEDVNHYALHLDAGHIIDGYRMGNIGRYVNHSCQPCCEMQKWNVNGLYRMVLFALRDIEAGEELSYDYNFDPFNQETQQECRCGSSECRGVIGGKRTAGTVKQIDRVADDIKDKRKSKNLNKKVKDKPSDSLPVQPLTKPMTLKERCYARKHRTFLVRNVDKVRNQKNPGEDLLAAPLKEEINTLDCTKITSVNPDLMLATLNEKSVKTRLAAYAKDNPELAQRHQLAQIFDKMLTELLSLKDESGVNLVMPLMALPSRKKQPQYYEVVRQPIDLSMIKQRVKTGTYSHLKTFNDDLMLLFSNVELYCGHKSDLGQIVLKLRRVLECVKTDVSAGLDEILGPGATVACRDQELARLELASTKGHEEPEEDIIRCICGVTRDEGLMLMCEKCLRWQHCDCVRASGKEEHYLCDRCEPRYYSPEILLNPPPGDAMSDCAYHMTLLKDGVQYAVGDCVYVMRDCKLRTSHRLLAATSPHKMDIFRVDQLWKDSRGERFASGTPYLRPQETFHEPTRKFYHNELFRTPNFEMIPMELVMGKCCVMDPNTFSKGRPKGVREQDCYICEYRVDKTAHLFYKIQKIWYPINTSRFCFDWYDKKLTMKRTFSPHEIPEEYKRKAERNNNCSNSTASPITTPLEAKKKKDEKKDEKSNKKPVSLNHGKLKMDESIRNDAKIKAEVKIKVKKGGCGQESLEEVPSKPKVGRSNRIKRQERKQRLDKILIRLLANIPGKQPVDLTYLLEGEKRIRKKITR